MQQQMSVFKKSLEDFALNHKNEIRKDPLFRAQFQTMCANIGVDPLSSNKVMSIAFSSGILAKHSFQIC